MNERFTFGIANVDTGIESSVTVKVLGDSIFVVNNEGGTLAILEVCQQNNEEHLKVFVAATGLDYHEMVVPTANGVD